MRMPTLGKIVSHGYLLSGYFPVRIALPTLASVLLGPATVVPSQCLLQSFRDYLGQLDRSTIREASKVKGNSFGTELSTKLLSVLSRSGCRKFPTPHTLADILLQIAHREFISRPYAAITLMNGGLPPQHRPFWQQITLPQLQLLYSALGASAQKVLELIEEPMLADPNEERVFGYLREFIANLKVDEVSKFLRFVTSSGVCLEKTITISFNGLSGLVSQATPIALRGRVWSNSHSVLVLHCQQNY